MKALYGPLIGFTGKIDSKNMKNRCIWEKFLRFAAVNSHCRHRNMAAVNTKKNRWEKRNFHKFIAYLRLEEKDILIYEPTFFNPTSQRYFGQVRNLAGLKHI